MEGRDDFLRRLESTLEAHREQLESEDLVRLQELLRVHQTYYENIYNIFLRKALISEDPYKYDERIAEVQAPSSEPFLESERQEQMGQRMASFHSQLEFLNSTFQPSVEFVTMDRIRRISGLIRYIQWHNISESNPDLITRAVADYLNRVKGGSDKVSTQIVLDSVGQLAKGVKEILGLLNKVVQHQREAYKSSLRRDVLPELGSRGADDEATLAKVKQVFARQKAGIPFYGELAKEVLREEYGPGGEEAKEQVLQRLEVKGKEKPKQEKTDFKGMLLQAIRSLAAAGMQLEDCIAKLKDNNTLYTTRKKSFAQRLSGMFRKLAGASNKTMVYEIEYFDTSTPTPQREKVAIDSFLEDLEKRAKLLSALTVSRSPASTRLRQAPEEKVYEFLNRQLAALQSAHRRLTGLNEFFRVEMPADKKARVRGLRVELAAIKNLIIKTNQQRHDYIGAKEEEEQLAKLMTQDRAQIR